VDDVMQHCSILQDQHPSLPLFLVGHSMGGMIALRCDLRSPELFQGLVLNGALVVTGPQLGPLDLRPTPWRTRLARLLLGGLSYLGPEVCLGGPDLPAITRDPAAQALLQEDRLRWPGGCKVMLLYAFVLAMGDTRGGQDPLPGPARLRRQALQPARLRAAPQPQPCRGQEHQALPWSRAPALHGAARGPQGGAPGYRRLAPGQDQLY
jgi:alpha-beta hydrolase superfamily lysophospholipase